MSKLTQIMFPLLSTALLATACSDSTAPSTKEGSAGESAPASQPTGPSSTPTDSAAGPADTTAAAKPAFYVESTPPAKVYGETSIGQVTITTPSVGCASTPFGRSVAVSGIRVTNLDGHNGSAEISSQYIRVFVYLWRYNSTAAAWQKVGISTWTSPNQWGIYQVNWNSVPTASFLLNLNGYYSVTVHVEWIRPWGVVAYRNYAMNSAADYAAVGNVIRYTAGYCFIA